jgi:hypothetical protein
MDLNQNCFRADLGAETENPARSTSSEGQLLKELWGPGPQEIDCQIRIWWETEFPNPHFLIQEVDQHNTSILLQLQLRHSVSDQFPLEAIPECVPLPSPAQHKYFATASTQALSL